MSKTTKSTTVTPLGDRVLVKRVAADDKTKGGIILPGDNRIPNLFGRVVAVSRAIKQSYEREGVPVDSQVRELDKVIYFNGNALPEDPERIATSRVLVPLGNIVGKIVKKT